jgi:hypothetical protein
MEKETNNLNTNVKIPIPNFIENALAKIAPKLNIDTSVKEQWSHLDVGTAVFVTCINVFSICFSYLITTSYKDEDGETWFKEFDDRDLYQDSKWEINDKLELLLDTFDEEFFMDFVKHYFNIDLREKGNKKYDWVFR